MSKTQHTVSWIAQIVSAAILGQTLFFKFTGAPEAVWIFSTLGVEPAGRIFTGVVEAIAVVLLLVPRTAALGGGVGLGLMGGAILSHLFVLGIEVQGDGGTLFWMGVLVAILCTAIVWLRRAELPVVGTRFASAQRV